MSSQNEYCPVQYPEILVRLPDVNSSLKVILLMFWLETLVLLRANEAKLWGTSICSYVKTCWHVSLLIAHIGHACWLFDLRCSQVDSAHTGSTFELFVCGDPAVRYVIAIVVIKVWASLVCRLHPSRLTLWLVHPSLRSKTPDPLPTEKQANVSYKVLYRHPLCTTCYLNIKKYSTFIHINFAQY